MSTYGSAKYGTDSYGSSAPANTWRIANVTAKVAAAPSGTWRVAAITATVLTSSWRLASITATSTAGPTAKWRVAKVAAAINSGWRVANASVVVSQATTPLLSPLASATIDPVMPYSVTASTANGVSPDTWTWHLGTTPNGSDLDRLLIVAGPVVTFAPPGTQAGITVYLTVTASRGGATSVPQSATYVVIPADHYYLSSDGTLRPMSPIYYLRS